MMMTGDLCGCARVRAWVGVPTHSVRLLEMQSLEQQLTRHTAASLVSLANHFVQVMEAVQQTAESDKAGGVTFSFSSKKTSKR